MTIISFAVNVMGSWLRKTLYKKVRETKKLGCPVVVIITEIVRFPDFAVIIYLIKTV